MKSCKTLILRCALLALAVIAAAWLIAFASGVGWLVSRGQLHVGNAQGSTVTCRYVHATGTYEMFDFTENPEAVDCARVLQVRSPPVSGGHWAAPLPPDRSVQIECRFTRYPADGDDGLGTRFTGDAPLRLKVNLAARQLTVIKDEDRTLLGQPVFDPVLSRNPGAVAWVEFSHGALPVLAGPGHLTLTVTPGNGHAQLMLFPPGRPILTARDGGCRVST